eukprot:ANDGO_05723.mRNA.1 Terminal uridylyltransferase cid1
MQQDCRECLSSLVETFKLSSADWAAVSAVLTELKALLLDCFGSPGDTVESVPLHIFGSFSNGFCTHGAFDIDMMYLNPAVSPERVLRCLRNAARSPKNRLVSIGRVIDILHARVPLVKFAVLVKTADSRLPLQCDLSFGANPKVLLNSELLSTYSRMDPRVRPLGLLVKHWGKRRGIVSSTGYFNSYSLILMLLFYLQQQEVIPVLELNVERGRLWAAAAGHMKMTCKDFPDVNHLSSYLFPSQALSVIRTWKSKNDLTVDALLYGFFAFFANDFDYSTRAVSIRVQTPVLRKDIAQTYKDVLAQEHLPAQELHFADRLIWIEDPIDTFDNAARSIEGLSFPPIQFQFYRAFSLGSERHGYDLDLFIPCDPAHKHVSACLFALSMMCVSDARASVMASQPHRRPFDSFLLSALWTGMQSSFPQSEVLYNFLASTLFPQGPGALEPLLYVIFCSFLRMHFPNLPSFADLCSGNHFPCVVSLDCVQPSVPLLFVRFLFFMSRNRRTVGSKLGLNLPDKIPEMLHLDNHMIHMGSGVVCRRNNADLVVSCLACLPGDDDRISMWTAEATASVPSDGFKTIQKVADAKLLTLADRASVRYRFAYFREKHSRSSRQTSHKDGVTSAKAGSEKAV